MKLEMSDAPVVLEDFPAPERTIVSVAESVADDGREVIESVFGSDRESMGTVMLDGDERNIECFGKFSSVERSLIFRMRVTEQNLRCDAGGCKKTIDGGPIAIECFRMRRVADVLGERDASVAIIEGEGVVHFGTERENGRGTGRIERDGAWDETTAPADEQWCFIDDFENGIVGRLDDSSVMVEDERDELFGPVDRERGMREVGRGTNEWLREMLEEEDVERGRGEHDADRIKLARVRRSGIPACEDDGALRREQSSLLLGSERRDTARHRDVTAQYGIGFPMSSRQGIEFPDGSFFRVAEEMKATDTFDGDDFISLECAADGTEFVSIARKIEEFPVFVESEFRSADRTSDRLGMKTSIGRIRVFFPTVGAHGEVAHRRGRAIVGT